MIFSNAKLMWSLLFLAVLLCLLVGNFAEINALHTESGDFAADSLLIQDAKSFKLLVGHYSWLGFNHPGPAILYVLALGELIFFDWLHMVPSPFSGQLIAVAFYNAFWIVLLVRLLYKIVHPIHLSVLFLSFFLGCAALINHTFYSGPWPPALFFFPFTVFLLAITLFQESRVDSLYSLALSMGVLINGYASFIVLLGLLFSFALIYNYWIYPGNNKILSKGYFIAHKKNLVIALALFVLFLIPIFIQTAIDFPGPLADYIRYGRDDKGHKFVEAIRFVAFYWGGLLPLSLGMLVCFLGVLCYKKHWITELYTSSICSLCATLLFTSLIFLYYAKNGVRELLSTYVGWFYYAVPALFIAMFLVVVFRKINKKQSSVLSASVLIAAFFFLGYQNFREVRAIAPAITHYQPDLIQLYDALNQHKTEGRLVFNFNYDSNGLDLWSSVMALAALAKREHNDLFCVNNSWQISFTKAAKCTKFESIHNKHFFFQHSDVISDFKPFFKTDIVAVYNVERFDLTHVKFISTQELLKSPTQKIFEHGWSGLEFDYVWTEGKQSSMVFNLDKGFSGQIGLELVATLPQLDFIQEVSFYINGQYIKKARFSFADNRKLILLPVHSSPQQIHVELRVKSPVLTIKGIYLEKKRLGVALFGVAIKPRNQQA
ncbi:hypothetical protein [uncultured Legionella sp.]|uniref:hypothetical protein n=1 Tax=uncultured Legionella sp. TaxID=210934 RepID=UPI00263665BB|nr:hypothetical protein [uncultured Legionella sp.]